MTTNSASTTGSNMWKSGVVMAAALQRCGHYGIRSVLIIYLVRDMKTSGQQAGQIYGLFYGSLFITSLIGGLLGDSKFGRGRSGSLGLMFMLAGNLGLSLGSRPGTMVALALYSIGFGLFDPNMNVAIAHKYVDREHLRDAAYTVLYTAINIGAMLGPLLFGYIALRINTRFAFFVGGLWPMTGFLLFNHATRNEVVGTPSKDIVKDTDPCKEPFASRNSANTYSKRLMSLTVLGLAGIVFFAVFDQLGSSVTLLAYKYVVRTIGSFELPAGYVQSINPFFVIFLGPLFSLAMKHRRPSRQNIGRIRMLSLGALVLGSSFGLLALASNGIGHAGPHNTVKWSWVLVSIFLATVGELLFAPISLSLAANLSPPRWQAFILGAWSATYGLGAYLSGTMSGLMAASGLFSRFFGISAAACFITGLLLWAAAYAINAAKHSDAHM